MTLNPRTHTSPTSPTHTPSPRKAILVVDDDEGMRAALYDVLSSEYRVTLAVDGIDGYVKAHEQPPQDLIIADVRMPQLDGITMVRRIRENDVLRHVPVIFFTGQMPPANLITAQAVGPVACLAKPIDPEVLENSVKLALSGART
jgi:two-component system, chemotaxis family, chemotaxis protein CheY